MTAWNNAVRKVTALADDELQRVWANLKGYDPRDLYAPGVSMDEWASLVYSEMCIRDLPRS